MKAQFDNAVGAFHESGGVLRMAEALRAGVDRNTLYAMHADGVVEKLSRGVYRLAELPGLEAPDLTVVTSRVPGGVVCLISALAFHELTTQVPHAVDIAIRRGAEKPRIEYPPANVYWMSGKAFSEGIETPTVDGRPMRIYGPEKSVADAFKYRNKIGLDVAIEALRTWRERKRPDVEKLMRFAGVCRVARVMRPYIEAVLSSHPGAGSRGG